MLNVTFGIILIVIAISLVEICKSADNIFAKIIFYIFVSNIAIYGFYIIAYEIMNKQWNFCWLC